jgi:hypothetical protein
MIEYGIILRRASLLASLGLIESECFSGSVYVFRPSLDLFAGYFAIDITGVAIIIAGTIIAWLTMYHRETERQKWREEHPGEEHPDDVALKKMIEKFERNKELDDQNAAFIEKVKKIHQQKLAELNKKKAQDSGSGSESSDSDSGE